MKKVLMFVLAAIISVSFASVGFTQDKPATPPTDKPATVIPEKIEKEKPAKVKKAKKKTVKKAKEVKSEEKAVAPSAPEKATEPAKK